MSEGDKTPSRYVVITENAVRDAEPSSVVEAQAEAAAHTERSGNPEAVRRVEVAEEDRMAFRVGVNLLVLLFIGVGGYLLWRHFFG
ncbi:MAG: hypothetical protein KF813_04195 [Trueperaceae bacterium]|nr:hypothetical protein [Trueperaceae bacterium]